IYKQTQGCCLLGTLRPYKYLKVCLVRGCNACKTTTATPTINFSAAAAARATATVAAAKSPYLTSTFTVQRSPMVLPSNQLAHMNAVGQNSNMQVGNHNVNKASIPLQLQQQQ